MRLLVHEPMKTRSTGCRRSAARLEAHVCSARSIGGALQRRPALGGVGHAAVDRQRPSRGLVPQVTCGAIVAGVERDLAVELRAGVGGQRAPVGQRLLPRRALGRERPALDVGEGGVVRRDRPARAPASIAMLQTVMRPSIDSARMAAPAYSITWPVPPAVPIRPMMARTSPSALTPAPSVPSTSTSMFLAGAWSSVCVASTCSTSDGADAEGQRAERAVRRGVAVAADDRHARLASGPAPGR